MNNGICFIKSTMSWLVDRAKEDHLPASSLSPTVRLNTFLVGLLAVSTQKKPFLSNWNRS